MSAPTKDEMLSDFAYSTLNMTRMEVLEFCWLELTDPENDLILGLIRVAMKLEADGTQPTTGS